MRRESGDLEGVVQLAAISSTDGQRHSECSSTEMLLFEQSADVVKISTIQHDINY